MLKRFCFFPSLEYSYSFFPLAPRYDITQESLYELQGKRSCHVCGFIAELFVPVLTSGWLNNFFKTYHSPPPFQSALYHSYLCVIQTWTLKYAQTNRHKEIRSAQESVCH